jgi:hypothetical protein
VRTPVGVVVLSLLIAVSLGGRVSVSQELPSASGTPQAPSAKQPTVDEVKQQLLIVQKRLDRERAEHDQCTQDWADLWSQARTLSERHQQLLQELAKKTQESTVPAAASAKE